MRPMSARERRRRHRARTQDRKDRLIQTRVAEELERRLKDEAAKRRLTVSHLIRNTLEDAFDLVENVTSDVGQLVTGSVELAAAVSRDARRLASIVRGLPVENDATNDVAPSPQDPEGSSSSPGNSAISRTAGPANMTEADALDHVYGWNRVVANRGATCARCGADIARGDDTMVGLSDDPTKPRAWLCPECADKL